MRETIKSYEEIKKFDPESYQLEKALHLVRLIKHNMHGKNLSAKERTLIHKFTDEFSCRFYSRFTNEYAQLATIYNITICCFIRLGFNNIELTYFCRSLSSSVRSHKYQLKKKLGLKSNIKLDDFIKNY